MRSSQAVVPHSGTPTLPSPNSPKEPGYTNGPAYPEAICCDTHDFAWELPLREVLPGFGNSLRRLLQPIARGILHNQTRAAESYVGPIRMRLYAE